MALLSQLYQLSSEKWGTQDTLLLATLPSYQLEIASAPTPVLIIYKCHPGEKGLKGRD